jgi:hypothetical protein
LRLDEGVAVLIHREQRPSLVAETVEVDSSQWISVREPESPRRTVIFATSFDISKEAPSLVNCWLTTALRTSASGPKNWKSNDVARTTVT